MLVAFPVLMVDDFQNSTYFNAHWAPLGTTGLEWLYAYVTGGEVSKSDVKYDSTNDPGNYVLRTYYAATGTSDAGWFAAEYVDETNSTPSWGDVSIEVSFKVNDAGANPWDSAVLYFRLTDFGIGGGGNELAYYLLFKTDGYCELGYFCNGTHTAFAGASFSCSADITKWTRVRVEVEGSGPVDVRTYVNGDLIADYNITDSNHYYPTGGIGLGLLGEGTDTVEVFWDEVRVTSLDAEKVLGESFDFESVAGSYFEQFSPFYNPSGLAYPETRWKVINGVYEEGISGDGLSMSALWGSSVYGSLDLSYSADIRTEYPGSYDWEVAKLGFRYSGKVAIDSGFYSVWITKDGSKLVLSHGTGTDVYQVSLSSPVDITQFHRIRVDTIGDSSTGKVNIRVWLDGVEVMDYDIVSGIEDGRGLLLISANAGSGFDNVEVRLASPRLLSPSDSFSFESTKIRCTWSEVKGAVGYLFQLSRDSSFSDVVLSENVTINYIDVQLPGEGTYYWRVKALSSDENASSYFSEVYTFKVVSETAQTQEEETTGALLSSFVLKAGQDVTINLKALGLTGTLKEARVYLADPFGTVVVSNDYQAPEDSITFALPEGLPSGIYVLKLKVASTEGEVLKFVKIFVKR